MTNHLLVLDEWSHSQCALFVVGSASGLDTLVTGGTAGGPVRPRSQVAALQAVASFDDLVDVGNLNFAG